VNSNSTEIILVRHGQTEWNRIERFRGRVDIPLNNTGLEQAQAIATRLAKLSKPAMIYSSPLERCLKTAEPIGKATGAPVQALDGIIDIDYGDWQGLTPEEAEKQYPDVYRVWLSAPHKAVIPGGETLDQVRARALAALEQAAQQHLGQTIILVSHKVVCKVLVCAVLGLDNSHFWYIEQDNAAINVFERNGLSYLVKSINDTCHLERVR